MNKEYIIKINNMYLCYISTGIDYSENNFVYNIEVTSNINRAMKFDNIIKANYMIGILIESFGMFEDKGQINLVEINGDD